MIKQDRLVRELYRACFEHDDKKIAELRKIEFQKILKRRESGKPFTTHWALVRI
jgi:hypothetical protein